MSASSPLLVAADLAAPIAWRAGAPVSAARFLADAERCAERLPARGEPVNLCRDRYRFAVALAAALMRGQTSLLPPNALPETLAALREHYAAPYALCDEGAPQAGGLPLYRVPSEAAPAAGAATCVPAIAGELLASCLLTSGSTGEPQPHARTWASLVANIGAEAERLASLLGRASLAGFSLVATVPPQHSYGFESSVLLALLSGAALESGRPFYPADIAAALRAVPRPRALVTTPFHLKALLLAGIELPPCDLVLCATAPLSPQLAAEAERALRAPLIEIYGCTEAGQVATRRTTAGEMWQTLGALRITREGTHEGTHEDAREGAGETERFIVRGGHVQAPTPLADVLQLEGAQRFRLLGRANDLIHVAGKRSSLAHLNYHLNRIEGVRDGAFWVPDEVADGVVRPIAFVVAPELSAARIIAALRASLDAAFVPRRVVQVDALPREATGKLTAQALRRFALERSNSREGAPTTLRAGGGAAMGSAPIRLTRRIGEQHPAFAGHFPGAPLLPGVALVNEVLEAILDQPALADRIGRAPMLDAAKFLVPVRPDTRLCIELRAERDHSVAFEVTAHDRSVARGRFSRGSAE